MCTHRNMFDSDQAFVDALVNDAIATEKKVESLKSEGTVDQNYIDLWTRYAKKDRALAVQFQKALNEGKDLNSFDVTDPIFSAVYDAEDNGTIDQLIATPVDAAPVPVGA